MLSIFFHCFLAAAAVRMIHRFASQKSFGSQQCDSERASVVAGQHLRVDSVDVTMKLRATHKRHDIVQPEEEQCTHSTQRPPTQQ